MSSDSSEDEEWTARRSRPAKSTSDENENNADGFKDNGCQLVAKKNGSKREKKLGRISVSTSPVSSDKNVVQKMKTSIEVKTFQKKNLASRKKSDSGQSDTNVKQDTCSPRSKFGAGIYQVCHFSSGHLIM